jgi:beta-glucanase (GH16 family)
MSLITLSKQSLCACAALAMTIAPPLVHAAPPPGPGWNLVWSDEFEGETLDLTKGRHRLTGLRRQAFNTPGAVKVADGNLAISTFTVGSSHFTGMVATHETFLYTYGYIEARIRFDTSPGMWSAFWMQSPTMGDIDIYQLDSNLAGTEIDICEHRAINQNGNNISSQIVGNIHWNGYGANHKSIGYTSPNLDLGNGHHIYGMEWTPTQQKFYINGVLRWTLNNASNAVVSNRSEYIWLSSEVENSASVDWAGPIPAGGYGSIDTTTTKMFVDYVRVYQKPETVSNADFGGRIAPFDAINEATWSSTGGRTHPMAGKLAPTTAAGASLRQTLHGLMPDTGYTLTAWGNPGTTSPSLFLGVENHGFPVTGQTLTAANSYAQATVPFTTGPTHRSATVVARSKTAGSIAHVDDFLLRRAAHVTNGQFETGDRHGWTSLYGNAAVTTDNSYGGDYSVNFPITAQAAGIEQPITGLTPGTPYRLTAWTTNANSGLNFGVKNHGASQVTSNVSANDWTQATVNFTTGAASTGATIFAFRGNGTQLAYADAFFLSQPFSAPWTGSDVGAVGLTGTSGRLGEKFVVQATGAGMSGGVDQCHFIHRPHDGDGTLTTRVLGVDILSNHSRAGIMLRDSTASNSRNVALTWNPVTGQVEFFRRSNTGGTTPATTTTPPGSVPAPPWLRLTRRGNDFTPYWSADGESWTRVDQPRVVAMATPMLAGLVVATGVQTHLGEAAFDRVTLTTAVPDVQITEPANATALAGNGGSLRLVATLTGGSGAAIQWSKVAGPGTVTFSNAATATAHAAFSAPGIYHLRCSATNGAGTGTGDITIHVTPFFQPDPSLVMDLKLDETSGTTATDRSGSGNPATLHGAATWQPTGGKLGGSVALDGSDGWLAVADSPSLDSTAAFTLSLWFKADSFHRFSALAAKRVTDTNQNAYGLSWSNGENNGRLRIDINSNNDRFLSNTVFSSSTWYHVALVFDGTRPAAERAKLYVNGILDITATETSTSVINSTAPLLIGRFSATDPDFFDGSIDSVRFHRRALAAVEIAALASESAVSAPVVFAGPAPDAMISTAAPLAGRVDVGTGPAATPQWTKIGGPGTAVFADAASPTTTVTFNQAGTYQLRLTATSSAGQVHQNIEVLVAAPTNPSTYAGWKELTWPGVNDSTITDPAADPDRDGNSNLLEWALHLDPKTPDVFQPILDLTAPGHFFTYTRRKTAPGAASFQVEWSDTLRNDWSTAAVGIPTLVAETATRETWSVPIPLGPTRRFFQVRITTP